MNKLLLKPQITYVNNIKNFKNMIYLSIFALQAVIILFMQWKFSDMDGRTVKLKLVDFIPFVGIGIFLFRYATNFD